jgi:hypothetical protein
MRNLILVPLVVFTLGAEDAPQVCSQGPNTTVAATTTTPGPEVDLTRSWVENTKGTTGLAQFRLGITRWLDVRATNDAFMTQMAFRVSDSTTLGLQNQWGSKQDKTLFLFTQDLGSGWGADINFGSLWDKNPLTPDKTRSTEMALNFYLVLGRWSFGAEVVRVDPNKSPGYALTPMIYSQFQPINNMALYLGVTREIHLNPHHWGAPCGISVRF